MRSQKLYAGVELREARRSAGMTQRDFAESLGISLSYLNQMENNHRPLSAAVVLALSERFDFDLARLSVGEAERMVADMREALADPVFEGISPPVADLALAASNAPALARAFLALHRAWRQAGERVASLDEALGRGAEDLAPLPWEEVRDFFHYCDNYIDAVDRAAEHFSTRAGLDSGLGARTAEDRVTALAAWLSAEKGVGVRLTPDGPIRRFDGETIHLSARAPAATRAFQIAHQIALLYYGDLISATLDLAGFRSDEAREIARIGLANYFAGAAMMPYRAFIDAADGERHDIEALADLFGCSLEQVSHRLSTLQRPGAKGVPFFFVRVDQAGTVTKRHSATRLQFARYGGACPLWNVHQAFETPGRLLRQLAETPDGARYICLSTDVSKPGGGFRRPTQRYAISLGCETRHADRLVYADDLDLARPEAYAPIGVSCRICERRDCHQRSVPPLRAAIRVERDRRDILPYAVADKGAGPGETA